MRRVLVTHADSPIGRRVVKVLYHDERVAFVFGVGAGPPPRAFDRFLAGPGPRFDYARVDLARYRPVNDLFHSESLRRIGIDSVVYVPRHEDAPGAPIVGGLDERTEETRLLVQHCLEAPAIRHLVALGSAYVYRLPPGNVNRLDESSELDFDREVPPEIRAWIDSDMILHGEIHSDRIRVVLLRVPTVVGAGGAIYLNPALTGRRARFGVLGFDPICALVSDKDVARAIRAALQARAGGIFNIAGRESLPLSTLARWSGPPLRPLPGPLLSAAAVGTRLLRAGNAPPHPPHLRYGFTLDTRRAERSLGFVPGDRIGVARIGDGVHRLEAFTT